MKDLRAEVEYLRTPEGWGEDWDKIFEMELPIMCGDEEENGVPGGRYFEPGAEDAGELPEDEWLDDDFELPFV